jgi:DNA-binding LacI/PurR family transcriptional regulator
VSEARRPTMHDVARRAGVSLKTVSNVVNDDPRVLEANRARVLAAIAELDYRPNITARNLRSGRSGVISLAVPELSQAYFAQLADDVIRAAAARHLVVLVEQTGGHPDRELEVLRSPRLSLSDGLLFSPLGLTTAHVAPIKVEFPVVILGERLLDGPVDNITMQNRPGARAATEHLLGLGRRRVALIGAHGGEVDSTAGLRMAGYRDALEAAGVPFDEVLIAPIEVWDRPSGARAMQVLLDTGAKPDAVFAMNDDLALGALRVLLDRGLRVPEDVALMGFDDVDECSYSVPRLSTIDPGRRKIAEMAVDLLIERVGERGGATGRELSPTFRLVERESTGG